MVRSERSTLSSTRITAGRTAGSAAALLLIATAALAAPEKPTLKAESQHELPDDPRAVVISMDYKGGMLPRKDHSPVLQILANGTVRIGNPWGLSREVEGQISQLELQQLLNMAIAKNSFFKFDQETVKQAIRAEQQAGGLFFRVADASTTVIRIHADGKDHTAEYYALSMHARQHPKIEELQQLLNIQQRLQQVMSVVKAGGVEATQAYLKQANAELKKQAPQAAPLTIDDLQSVNIRANGQKNLRFYRAKTNESGRVVSYVSVQIDQPEQGEPTYTVQVRDLPQNNTQPKNKKRPKNGLRLKNQLR